MLPTGRTRMSNLEGRDDWLAAEPEDINILDCLRGRLVELVWQAGEHLGHERRPPPKRRTGRPRTRCAALGEYTNRSLTEATVTIARLASGARQSQGIAWTSESFRGK